VIERTTPLLEAAGLTRHYHRGGETVAALEKFDVTLHAGEVVALVGPSGSGKTTLLNVLCGWERADAGHLSWKGRPGVALETLGWSEIAVVPQSAGLLEDLTVAENVGLPQRLRARDGDGVSGDDVRAEFSAEQLLMTLGLDHLGDRLPQATSLGEQQRAAVARAVLLGPALLLADEPTAHQDGVFAEKVVTLLAAAAERGSCCVIATHSSDVITRAHRVITLGAATV
jgi:ABC-type lipoprotein export system ATPase subunit